MAPAGRRGRALPDPDGKAFRSALWSVDPAGDAAAARLTRSAAGESNAAFLPDGSLLFTSARPDPDAKPGRKADETPPAALWLPPGGRRRGPPAARPAGRHRAA